MAILDDVVVEFGDGFNVLTGETGAGKSILVDALALVAGGRGDRSLVRGGSERAIVEALFELDPEGETARRLAEHGIGEPGASELIVRREVGGSAGRIWIDGSPCTLGLLAEIGPALVELHGQHEFRTLLAPERQLGILDRYAGEPQRLAATAEAHAAAERARSAVRSIEDAASRRVERLAELGAFVREIDGLGIRPGELSELDRERRILRNASTVSRLLDELVELTEAGDPSASGLAASAARRARELAATDASVADLAERLDAASIELQDVGDAFRAYRERVDFRPDRADRVESRHAELTRVLLRHAATEEEIVARRAAAGEEIAALERVEDELTSARAEVILAESRYADAALALREVRRAAAERLEAAVVRQLKELALARARFAVRLDDAGGDTVAAPRGAVSFGARGADRVEFRLAANPGETEGALHRCASGGELSRVLLALHAAAEDTAPGRRVLVFDEVDTGIGGGVADAVGARLHRLARRNQVLCVTHLAQVAAHADRHFSVHKEVAGGRTRALVTPLDDARRVEELARMVGGREATDVSRKHAADLVLAARRSGARAGSGKRARVDGGGP